MIDALIRGITIRDVLPCPALPNNATTTPKTSAMNWIASRMLMGDRAKYFGLIFGVAFATLLMSQQVAFLWGSFAARRARSPTCATAASG